MRPHWETRTMILLVLEAYEKENGADAPKTGLLQGLDDKGVPYSVEVTLAELERITSDKAEVVVGGYVIDDAAIIKAERGSM